MERACPSSSQNSGIPIDEPCPSDQRFFVIPTKKLLRQSDQREESAGLGSNVRSLRGARGPGF